jgi:VIT1/CCC1 family predicted Fe2+/Mn2+ transporter
MNGTRPGREGKGMRSEGQNQITDGGSLRTGLSFGLTSGVITAMGLMVGLHSGTHSRPVVIGGLLTIAIADSLADALGIHVSEESENVHTEKQIWISTAATFFGKFGMALTFLVPFFLFELPAAIIVSVIWGLGIMAVLSYKLALMRGIRPWKVILEHLAIALVVIVVTHFTGRWVALTFQ